MKKQTAVQLLKESIDHELKSGTKMVVNWDMYLAMEKEQIVDAFEVKKNRYVKKFYSDGSYSTVNEIIYTDGNQYYNETYGGDE